MKPVSRIHQQKTPVRRHFIAEWLEAKGMSAAELIDELNEADQYPPVDRSTVYRWLQGQLPRPDQQARLAAFFGIEPEALLRHPDQDWLASFFEGRQKEERERIKQAMELSWPKRQA